MNLSTTGSKEVLCLLVLVLDRWYCGSNKWSDRFFQTWGFSHYPTDAPSNWNELNRDDKALAVASCVLILPPHHLELLEPLAWELRDPRDPRDPSDARDLLVSTVLSSSTPSTEYMEASERWEASPREAWELILFRLILPNDVREPALIWEPPLNEDCEFILFRNLFIGL